MEGGHPFEGEVVYSKEWLDNQVADLQGADFVGIIGVEFDSGGAGGFGSHR